MSSVAASAPPSGGGGGASIAALADELGLASELVLPGRGYDGPDGRSYGHGAGGGGGGDVDGLIPVGHGGGDADSVPYLSGGYTAHGGQAGLMQSGVRHHAAVHAYGQFLK